MGAGKDEMHRVGIIPFESREQGLAVLFVTSQTRGRWVLPKGKQEEGESHAETCAREGFEEAGVKGVVLENFPITAPVTKLTKAGTVVLPVTYYPFLVTEQAESWPEKKLRERNWALLDDARGVTYDEDFLIVLQLFEALRPWIVESAEEQKAKKRKS